ncbi:MAG: sialate O-acetylesterase [Phycisphaerae bacterium]|nr:sialate O-acetylesterase [Phycisphaerae bacterium]
MRKVRVAAGLVIAVLAVAAAGDVELPDVIGDNMVLQRNAEVPVWGWADPGEQVTVTIAGVSQTTQAGPDRTWRVRLPAMQAGGPHVMTITGRNTITLDNVMVGEVWLCSGQANMLWEVRWSAKASQEIPAAHYPNIRLFTVTKKTIHEPTAALRGWWLSCNPKTVGGFSAVAYYFGRELHHELNVPIGLILSSVSGTAVELWTPREVLLADPQVRAVLAEYEKALEALQAQAAKNYQEALARWQVAVREARAEGRPEPRKPNTPKPARKGGCYYNGMIYPLAPYGIAGVIWYQGESNVQRPDMYARVLPAMIASWRKLWGQGDYPFLFVQLSNYMERRDTPTDSNWARLREAQLKSLSVPKTAMAVTIDIGEADDIHPRNKQDVGRRLALAALKVAYGRDVVCSGPILDSMTVSGDKAVLSFRNVGSGLAVKGEKLSGFAIAGANRQFTWAQATIRGDKVIVSSPDVPQPVAVRYGWADNPDCTLYNREGLPASPFRTDDWPGEQPTSPMVATEEEE